jgi:hypothetical protein
MGNLLESDQLKDLEENGDNIRKYAKGNNGNNSRSCEMTVGLSYDMSVYQSVSYLTGST